MFLRILFTLFFFIASLNTLSAQKRLKGKFCNYQYHFAKCLNFKNDSIFSYKTHVHMLYGDYGSGNYKILKKYIFLNFNKTKINYQKHSQYISSKWINDDSFVELNFKVENQNGPLPAASIWIDSIKTGTDSDFDGVAKLRLKKASQYYFINISYLGYHSLRIKIDSFYNYDFKVQLEEKKEGPTPIKDQIEKLKLININRNGFTVFNEKGEKQYWKKIED